MLTRWLISFLVLSHFSVQAFDHHPICYGLLDLANRSGYHDQFLSFQEISGGKIIVYPEEFFCREIEDHLFGGIVDLQRAVFSPNFQDALLELAGKGHTQKLIEELKSVNHEASPAHREKIRNYVKNKIKPQTVQLGSHEAFIQWQEYQKNLNFSILTPRAFIEETLLRVEMVDDFRAWIQMVREVREMGLGLESRLGEVLISHIFKVIQFCSSIEEVSYLYDFLESEQQRRDFLGSYFGSITEIQRFFDLIEWLKSKDRTDSFDFVNQYLNSFIRMRPNLDDINRLVDFVRDDVRLHEMILEKVYETANEFEYFSNRREYSRLIQPNYWNSSRHYNQVKRRFERTHSFPVDPPQAPLFNLWDLRRLFSIEEFDITQP